MDMDFDTDAMAANLAAEAAAFQAGKAPTRSEVAHGEHRTVTCRRRWNGRTTEKPVEVVTIKRRRKAA